MQDLPSSTHAAPVSLYDAFRDPRSREKVTIVFYDIVGSVEMKVRKRENDWVSTVGWVADRIREAVTAGGCGTIVKYTGDGAIVVYSVDDADQAINDGIVVQEAVQEGNATNRVDVTLTVGIATGEVVAFVTDPGGRDYVGLVVDCAARLCGTGSPQAILVDAETIGATRMYRVSSKVGAVMRRHSADYQGKLQTASLKGFASPVGYHEILWSHERFGIKSEVLTATFGPSQSSSGGDGGAAAAADARTKAAPGGSSSMAGIERQRGIVYSWKDDKRCAFIDGSNGQRYYTNDKYMVAGDNYLEREDIVYYCERPARAVGQLPVATAVIAVGQTVTGRIVKVKPGYGFAQVSDSFGNTIDVFVFFTDAGRDLNVGETISFEVAEGKGSPKATEISCLDEPPAKAA